MTLYRASWARRALAEAAARRAFAEQASSDQDGLFYALDEAAAQVGGRVLDYWLAASASAPEIDRLRREVLLGMVALLDRPRRAEHEVEA